MALAYPDCWEYVYGDVFQYVGMTQRTWDVVSIDCPSNLSERCAEMLPVWCLVANRAVILGVCGRVELDPLDGWEVTNLLHRSDNYGGTSWAVIERC